MRKLIAVLALVASTFAATAAEYRQTYHKETPNHWHAFCYDYGKQFSHCSSMTKFVANNERAQRRMKARSLVLGLHGYDPVMSRLRITVGSEDWTMFQDGFKVGMIITVVDGHYTIKQCQFVAQHKQFACDFRNTDMKFLNDWAMKGKLGIQLTGRNGVLDLGWFSLKGSLANLNAMLQGISIHYRRPPTGTDEFSDPGPKIDG